MEMNIDVIEDIDVDWQKVIVFMNERFEKSADLKSVLFAIGLRELGRLKKKFTKEEKQDLMNLATCQILTVDGYFEVSHLDADGWPAWEQKKALPPMDAKQQELFLKRYIIRYFKE